MRLEIPIQRVRQLEILSIYLLIVCFNYSICYINILLYISYHNVVNFTTDPLTVTTPTWTNVAAGSSVSMSCSCLSYPSPTVLWQQYQPDNSSAVWTSSSLATATYVASTSFSGVVTVTSTYSWSVGQNSDGSATYFRYWFRCYCYMTAYSTTYYTNSTGVEFLPTCMRLLL